MILFAILALCSSYRGDVKTLRDPGARQIRDAVDVSVRLSELLQQARPRDRLRTAQEKQLLAVTGSIVAYKLEDDGDYHVLVREDGTDLIITVELPAPQCVKGARWEAKMRAARRDLEKLLPSRPTRKMRLVVPIPVHVVGVVFFDKVHVQEQYRAHAGAAENGLEIHPALRIGARRTE